MLSFSFSRARALACSTLLSCGVASTAMAGSGHHHGEGGVERPDAHAPIGVMRDHMHSKGEWMLSYRYGLMVMDDNRNGTNSVSDQQVLADYMVAPTEMTMRMHMFGFMYGLTDNWTLSAMTMFMDSEMDHVRRDGSTFIMDNDGWGDSSVNAMYRIYDDGQHHVQLNAGIGLPTGATDDLKPNGVPFGYPMQPGSGTFSALPGISYTGFSNDWSWGSQLNAEIRIGENDDDYALGDRYQFTVWGARRLNDIFSLSARLDATAWDDVDGQNPRLQPPFMAPPLDPDLQDGERVDLLLGVNAIIPHGPLVGHRLAVEFGMPIYERLDGPRLDTEYRLTAGWQYAF